MFDRSSDEEEDRQRCEAEIGCLHCEQEDDIHRETDDSDDETEDDRKDDLRGALESVQASVETLRQESRYRLQEKTESPPTCRRMPQKTDRKEKKGKSRESGKIADHPYNRRSRTGRAFRVARIPRT